MHLESYVWSKINKNIRALNRINFLCPHQMNAAKALILVDIATTIDLIAGPPIAGIIYQILGS